MKERIFSLLRGCVKMEIRHLYCLLGVALLALVAFASCSENEGTWDPYYDWASRNEQWFASATDSAVTAISEAQALYGDDWEAHCDWRRYKSLLKAQDYDSRLSTDSICVHILQRGTGTLSPVWTDTVRLNFRAWLMPTTYRLYNDENELVDSVMQEVFSQSYYGPYDEQTAAPQLMSLGSTIEGFSTALQYMVEGDDWNVYIPSTLAYGSSGSGTAVPPYSTLLFRINLIAVYPTNSGVPDWK
ncbi:MAG: FKBP-type peptidyl-prolyl cis-trans isomerase [Prevotellaceae bacterium]|nr:FKBP-type peptidyl-prolyl cis-trans isomerase [Prevotellaceae bacterium]